MTQQHPQAKTTSLPATLWVPEFLRLDEYELRCVLHVLRDPVATQVYLLLLVHSDFKTGEFLGGYHRLMELCTPPQPERGRRRPGPSYKQLRTVIDDLIGLALATRDATRNALQGQLRLKLTPRERKPMPEPLEGRISGRVIKDLNLDSMRVVASPMDDIGQDKGQGFQGVNTSFNGSKTCELSTPVEDINRPPEGAGQAPHAPGQVEPQAALMAGEASAVSEQWRKGQEAAKALAAAIKKQPKQPSINRDVLQQRLNAEAEAREQRLQAQTQQGKGKPSTG